MLNQHSDTQVTDIPRCTLLPENVQAQISARSRALSLEVKDLLIEKFNKKFPGELVDKYGLTLVALGSLQRNELIPNCSDADITLLYTNPILDPDGDPAEYETIHNRYQAFVKEVNPVLKGLGLDQMETNISLIRKLDDTADEIEKSIDLALNLEKDLTVLQKKAPKIAIDAVTKLLFAESLVSHSDDFEADKSEFILKNIILKPEIFKKATNLLVFFCQEAHGVHSTLQTRDITYKKQAGRSCLYVQSVIELLKHTAVETQNHELHDVAAVFDQYSKFITACRAVNYHYAPEGCSADDIDHVDLFTPEKFNQKFAEMYELDRTGNGNFPAIETFYMITEQISYYFDKIFRSSIYQDFVNDDGQIKLADRVLEEKSYTAKSLITAIKQGENIESVVRGILNSANHDMLPGMRDLTYWVKASDSHLFLPLEDAIQAVRVIDQLLYPDSKLPQFKELHNPGFSDQHDSRFVSLASEIRDDKRMVACLYCAALFSDFKKPAEKDPAKDPEEHAILGAEAFLKFAHHLGLDPEQAEITANLIKYHLFLKGESESRSVIPAFEHSLNALAKSIPEEIKSPMVITLLTLLSYADGKTTDPENWNDFRNNTLDRYHEECQLQLNPSHQTRQPTIQNLARRILSRDVENVLPSKDEAEIINFLEGMSQEALGINSQTMSEFFIAFHELENPERDYVCKLFPHSNREGSAEAQYDDNSPEKDDKFDLIVVGKDRRGVANKIISLVKKERFKIHSANFFTKDNLVFNQLTMFSKTRLQGQGLKNKVLAIKAGLEKNYKTDVKLENPSTAKCDYTVCTFTSIDDENALEDQTQALLEHGLNVISANINRHRINRNETRLVTQICIAKLEDHELNPLQLSLKEKLNS